MSYLFDSAFVGSCIKKFGSTYVITLVTLLAIDGLWFSIMAPRFYKPYLHHLLSPSFKILPALLFYLIYAGAILLFVVIYSKHCTGAPLLSALVLGFLLGLASYGTYNLVNLATLRNWPLIVTVVDITWGACMTALVGLIAKNFSIFLARTL